MKWEDNIKQTLEERTIQPSEESWILLASRLDEAQDNKNRLTYWWIGIAAGLIVILFTVSIFFNTDDVELQQPVLVKTPNKDSKQDLPILKSPTEEQLAENSNEASDRSVVSAEKNVAAEMVTNQSNRRPALVQDVVAAHGNSNNSHLDNETRSERASYETEKTSEIVTQISDIRSRENFVTDADIEALLTSARQEIAYQNRSKHEVTTVDAIALLQDVEMDVQQSFRIKVFEAVKNSYETLKTAVAERHN